VSRAKATELSPVAIAALKEIARSPFTDPMTVCVIETFFRGDAGQELRKFAAARGVEFFATLADGGRLTALTPRLRISALGDANFAVQHAIECRFGNAERLAVAAAKRMARAVNRSGVSVG
jgi:hypothetical protein